MKAVCKKYIGCDAHSSTCTFCVVDEQGVVVESRTLVTNGRLIREYLETLAGHTVLCIEECGLSSWLLTILKRTVNEIMICNPVANKQFKRAKTDRLDAYNLAMLLRGGFLHPVYHDGSDQERLRIIVSAYNDLIGDITRIKNRFKALFRRQGICLKGKACYHDPSLITKLADSHARFVADMSLRHIAHYQPMVKEYEDTIKHILRSLPEAKILASLTGIGDIHAAQIIAQVINPHRFKNKHKYYSYCGLVRHVKVSDGRSYGSEYIWGNRMLKCVYKRAAVAVLKTRSALRTYYDQLRTRGLSHDAAKNALARKIATLSLYLWKHNALYDPKRVVNATS